MALRALRMMVLASMLVMCFVPSAESVSLPHSIPPASSVGLIQKKNTASSLRGGTMQDGHNAALRGEEKDEEDEDDDDDDDDDDDEESELEGKLVPPPGIKKVEKKASEATPAPQVKTSAIDKKTKVALETARAKEHVARKELQTFQDDAAFEKSVATATQLISNETQSPTLSSFLGELRREMRMYAKPTYPEYLEAKIQTAEKKVHALEAEIAAKKQGKEKAPKVAVETKPVVPEDDAVAKTEKAVEKEAVSEETHEASAELAQKAGETWAISFFGNIVLLSVVFAMAQSTNTLLKNYTWFAIDQVVAVFLAVMYFQAFDSLLDFHSLEAHHAVFSAILHFVIMLAMMLLLAYVLRGHALGLAIVCGAGAHIVAFSSIHAAVKTQHFLVGQSHHWAMCVFGITVLGLGLAIVGYIVYTAKKRGALLEEDNFMEKTDDLETDMGAMAFSVVFTMFVRFVLTGHHPEDDHAEFNHTKEQRMAMLIYACTCLVVSAFCVNFCTKKAAESDRYAVKRLMTFLNTVAAMNVAWAFLFWGEWEFFENLYGGEAIKGRVMFSIFATCLCGAGLVALTKLPSPQGKLRIAAKSDKMVALTALSLVVAWSWELCFDAAVEDMTEGVSHPVAWKIGSTALLFAIVVPVYALYMKPITGPAAEAIGSSSTGQD